MNVVLLLCLCVSYCYAIELTYGEKTDVNLYYGQNFFHVYVPSSRTPLITDIKDSLSLYYRWGSNVTLTRYDDWGSTYGNEFTLHVSNGSGDLYILFNGGEWGRVLNGEITVKNVPFLKVGARIAICIVSAVLALVFPSIIGKIIRSSYQDIDTLDRYRVTKLSLTGIIVGSALWFAGTVWVTVGSSLISVVYNLLWMIIVGPIFILLSILLMGFIVIDADRQQLKMKRFAMCCIPCGKVYDMNSFSVFYLGRSYGKHGRPIFRLEAKRTDGSTISLEITHSNVDVAGKQLIVEKLNTFISPKNRTTAPTYSDTSTLTIVELFIFSVAVTVASGPVQVIVNDLPTVTSQYLQELISPLPPDEQSSIMALFYSQPVVVRECVRDIQDTDLLRSTLIKLAEQ